MLAQSPYAKSTETRKGRQRDFLNYAKKKSENSCGYKGVIDAQGCELAR